MSESDNASSQSILPNDDGDISVALFGRTDVGLVREHNEDNFLVADLSEKSRTSKTDVQTLTVGKNGSLFAVCDGMGGAAAGEVASQLAVDTIYQLMQESDPPENDEALARYLDAAIVEAGLRIYTAARINRKRRGMGTTATAAAMVGPRLIIGQVGDSRAYIFRQGKLVQMTKDQSLVQQLIDANQLTVEEARNFDRSNIILQALGTAEQVHVDITSVVLRRGDILMMCSDGLCGLVETDDDILAVVKEGGDPREICRRLTDLACDFGGYDNITVIVAQFDGDGLSEPMEDEELAYRPYSFTSTAETTVRVLNPLSTEGGPQTQTTEKPPVVTNKSPNAKQKKTAQSKPQTPETKPEAKKTHIGLFAAAIAVLLLGGALFAFMMSADKGDGEADIKNVVAPPKSRVSEPPPASIEPVDDSMLPPLIQEDGPPLDPTPEKALTSKGELDTVPRESETENKKDQAASQADLLSQSDKPKESGDKGDSTGSEQVKETIGAVDVHAKDEPPLAPTPEDAIVGLEKDRKVVGRVIRDKAIDPIANNSQKDELKKPKKPAAKEEKEPKKEKEEEEKEGPQKKKETTPSLKNDDEPRKPLEPNPF